MGAELLARGPKVRCGLQIDRARPGSRRVTIAVLVGVLACTSAARASAADCPADPSVVAPSQRLYAASTHTRLRFITTQMDLAARRQLGWAVGWGVLYGAASIALLTTAPFVSKDTAKDLYVGGASAAIGAITRTVSRPKVIAERRRLRRRIAADGETCETLHAAEAALARSARWEHRNRRLLFHLGALGYNAAVGLVLGLALDRPLQGIRQAAIGAAVGQIMFVTQPMTSARAFTRYRGGFVSLPTARVRSVPWILPGGGGVGMLGRF